VKGYGQYCSVARALDLLGERWTLLIIRELLLGSTRFSELQRGIPRVSKTMLAARLKELTDASVITRIESGHGPTYALTRSGEELLSVVREIGTWGQRWLPRSLPSGHLDAETLLFDMRRRVHNDALPIEPTVVHFVIEDPRGAESEHYLLLRRGEVSLCSENPGFPKALRVSARLRTLTAWWRGDISWNEARAEGLLLAGRKEAIRAFPRWFERYLLAEVRPARSAARLAD
jgi:DNA-binding HxlR family transcriptional regulator